MGYVQWWKRGRFEWIWQPFCRRPSKGSQSSSELPEPWRHCSLPACLCSDSQFTPALVSTDPPPPVAQDLSQEREPLSASWVSKPTWGPLPQPAHSSLGSSCPHPWVLHVVPWCPAFLPNTPRPVWLCPRSALIPPSAVVLPGIHSSRAPFLTLLFSL